MLNEMYLPHPVFIGFGSGAIIFWLQRLIKTPAFWTGVFVIEIPWSFYFFLPFFFFFLSFFLLFFLAIFASIFSLLKVIGGNLYKVDYK